MRVDFYSEFSRQHLFTVFDSTKTKKENVFRTHHHPNLEIGYICEGEGQYCLGEKQYDAKSGDMFVVRMNEQHCVPTILSERLISFNLYISSYFIWNMCAEFISIKKLQLLIVNADIKQCFSDKGDIIKEIRQLMEKPEENRFLIKRKVTELLIKITDELEVNESREEYSLINVDAVLNTVAFINDNIKNPITLNDIIRQSGSCCSSFTKHFKCITGVTPYEYLLLQRIENASRLLLDTELSVLEIAYECGFNSHSNFNKIFKRITGLSPKEFRNRRN